MSENGSASSHDELYLIDGSSLAYRAFFALPESIATSTGVPTNAIFGFASMLVKLLTEHGVKPTIVVWDAGHSGRKEISVDYKATRQSRPDLLKEQWPHLAPLVEAFGYRNVTVDGYEVDDVIASIAEKARAQDVPVVVVTGDRDIFQLIDPESRVRVMATGRGITDTKLHDYRAVIDRYRDPAGADPRLLRPQGRHVGQHPGRSYIGDKTATTLLQQFNDLETVLASVDQISGAKRKENLTNHADDARDLQAAGDDHARRPRRRRSSPTGPRASPTAPSCATSSASSSCARRWPAWRRRWPPTSQAGVPAADTDRGPRRFACAPTRVVSPKSAR